MPCIIVTDASFERDVVAAAEPVLVDFWAQWCGPCRMVAPILDELSVELGSSVRMAKIDIDENPIVTSRCNVKSVPTVVMFHDGGVTATLIGPRTKSALKKWINDNLRSDSQSLRQH